MVEPARRAPAAAEDPILERARRRDGEAIRLIVEQHNRRLYRIARGIVRDDSEAEDVLQEAYVRAFSSLDQFRGEAQFGTWLARIVINQALASVRRRRPTLDVDRVEDSPALTGRIIQFPYGNPNLDPETTMAQREIRALLERAIDELPDAFRGVLIARLVEGLSVEETAELFGVLPQTVKTRLHRGRALLKLQMEKHLGPALGGAFPFDGARCDRFTDRLMARLGFS